MVCSNFSLNRLLFTVVFVLVISCSLIVFWRKILLQGGGGPTWETSTIYSRTGDCGSWRTGIIAFRNRGWGRRDEMGQASAGCFKSCTGQQHSMAGGPEEAFNKDSKDITSLRLAGQKSVFCFYRVWMRGFHDFLKKTSFHFNVVGRKFNLCFSPDDPVHASGVFGRSSFFSVFEVVNYK
jgi:hypothetical protein